MEIGEERVHDFEVIGGVNENAGLAAAGGYGGGRGLGGLAREGFQHADGGGADGDYPSARGLGFVDSSGGLLAQLVAFFVHRVGGDGFGLHRRKRRSEEPPVEHE